MEWKPAYKKEDVIPSILQIGFDCKVLLIDIYKLLYTEKEFDAVNILLNHLLSKSIVIGYGVEYDIKLLRDSYPLLNFTIKNVIDFTSGIKLCSI